MKKVVYSVAVALLCLCSCSNEENMNEISTPAQETEVQKLTAELTSRSPIGSFKDYKEQTTRSAGRRIGLTVLADAYGAISCRGSWQLMLLGGALNSLIYVCSNNQGMEGTLTDESCFDILDLRTGPAATIDSIGFFHNKAEYALYCMDSNSHLSSTGTLIRRTDSVIRTISSSYCAQSPTQYQIAVCQGKINTLRSVEVADNASMLDYYDAVYPCLTESSDEVDFVTQYIFDIFYGNEDPEEYTQDVIYMLDHSNANPDEIEVLRNSVLIGYSSILFNSSMNFNVR